MFENRVSPIGIYIVFQKITNDKKVRRCITSKFDNNTSCYQAKTSCKETAKQHLTLRHKHRRNYLDY